MTCSRCRLKKNSAKSIARSVCSDWCFNRERWRAMVCSMLFWAAEQRIRVVGKLTLPLSSPPAEPHSGGRATAAAAAVSILPWLRLWGLKSSLSLQRLPHLKLEVILLCIEIGDESVYLDRTGSFPVRTDRDMLPPEPLVPSCIFFYSVSSCISTHSGRWVRLQVDCANTNIQFRDQFNWYNMMIWYKQLGNLFIVGWAMNNGTESIKHNSC